MSYPNDVSEAFLAEFSKQAAALVLKGAIEVAGPVYLRDLTDAEIEPLLVLCREEAKARLDMALAAAKEALEVEGSNMATMVFSTEMRLAGVAAARRWKQGR